MTDFAVVPDVRAPHDLPRQTASGDVPSHLAYRIEKDGDGFAVVHPDGILDSKTWDDEEDAEHLADALNAAYALGRESR